MKMTRGFLLFSFIYISLVALQLGCFFKNDSKNPSSPIIQDTIPVKNSARVSFKIVLPRKALPESIKPSVLDDSSQAFVNFQIKLIDFDKPLSPISTVLKRVPVVDGSVTAIFESLPTTTIVGQITIENGNVGGYSEFHGSIDLLAGENTLELAPISSLMSQDVVATVVDRIISSIVLFQKAAPNLASDISKIFSGLASNSNSVYDEILSTFSTRNSRPVLEILSPLSNQICQIGEVVTFIASATDLDGTISSVEFFQDSLKIGEIVSKPFKVNWQGTQPGVFSLSAKAIDNLSGVNFATISIQIPGVTTENSYTHELFFSFDSTTGTITDYNTNGGSEVIIPPTIKGITVEHIGASAFSNKGLTRLVLPPTIKTIESGSFQKNFLTYLVIPEGVTRIEDKLVFSDNKIENLVLPSTLVYIGDGAFSGNQLSRIILPANLEFIGARAFSGNKLSEIEIPGKVSSIGDYAFNFNEINSVILPNSVTSIGDYAFGRNLITKISIGKDVSLGLFSFYENPPFASFDSAYYANGRSSGTYLGIPKGAWVLKNDDSNISPYVEIISPTINQILAVDETISIIASGTDIDGSISKIEFFQGTTKIGERTQPPYSITWQNNYPGSYIFSVKAYV